MDHSRWPPHFLRIRETVKDPRRSRRLSAALSHVYTFLTPSFYYQRRTVRVFFYLNIQLGAGAKSLIKKEETRELFGRFRGERLASPARLRARELTAAVS